MEQYHMCELEFESEQQESIWAQISLTAELECGDVKITIPGFYAGNGRYKVRFLPETAGNWHYRVSGCIRRELIGWN